MTIVQAPQEEIIIVCTTQAKIVSSLPIWKEVDPVASSDEEYDEVYKKHENIVSVLVNGFNLYDSHPDITPEDKDELLEAIEHFDGINTEAVELFLKKYEIDYSSLNHFATEVKLKRSMALVRGKLHYCGDYALPCRFDGNENIAQVMQSLHEILLTNITRKVVKQKEQVQEVMEAKVKELVSQEAESIYSVEEPKQPQFVPIMMVDDSNRNIIRICLLKLVKEPVLEHLSPEAFEIYKAENQLFKATAEVLEEYIQPIQSYFTSMGLSGMFPDVSCSAI